MAPPSEARFRRALARLDPDATAEFLAALLSARGDDTSVADGVVHAERDGRRRTFVVAGGEAERTHESATVFVDTGGREYPSAFADGGSGAYLGPLSLYRMLLYAVDRGDAERLAGEHLGLEFDAEETPWLADRLPAGVVTVEPLTAAAVALLVLVATVAGAASFVGGGGLVGPNADGAAGEGASAAANGSGGPTGAAVSVGREDATPPGIEGGSVEDVRALARAHRNVTEGRSYSLLVRGEGYLAPIRHRPSLATFFGQPPPWYAMRQRISVERPSVYRSRVTGIRADGGGSGESVVYDDYADGEAVYRRYGGENQTPRFGRLELNPGLISDATGSYVARYLSTPNTTVTRERGIYRVVATGAPSYLDVPAADYRAVAWVSPDGFVYRLEAEYEPAATTVGSDEPAAEGGTTTYTFAFSYDEIDVTDADRPPWYERARADTTTTVHPAGIQPDSDRPLVVDALAESHGAAVRSTSYRWRVDHENSLSGGLIEGRWIRSRQRVSLVGPSRYAFVARGAYRTENGSFERYRMDTYVDGQYRYRRRATDSGSASTQPVYDRIPLPVEPTDAFARIAEGYVRRYLATETVSVTVRENESLPRYRVVATGRPTRLPGTANVTQYRAVAAVRASGLVESLSVEYRRTEPGDTTGVEFAFAYDDVGTTTVDPPPWYDEARRAHSGDIERERNETTTTAAT